MEKISLGFIVNATGGRLSCAYYNARFSKICTDTRTIEPGSLYIALRGERFDGNDFVEEAFSKGAAAAIAQRAPVGSGRPVVIVGDTNHALLKLAGAYRRLFKIPVVGVTGSVGKTSTKEMIYSVLSQKYLTHRNQGNRNNQIGMPLAVLDLEKRHKAAVFEMGMSAFGEISSMSWVAAPNIGVITNIGISHIEKLGSRENILKAKLEILDGMKKNAALILNGDDNLLQTVSKKVSGKIYYGIENKECEFFADKIKVSQNGTSFSIHYPGGEIEAGIPVFGRHNIYNALAAFACGISLKMTPEEIVEGIAAYQPTGFRQKIEKVGGITFIEDCYNASPDSMKAAFDVLGTVGKGKRKIAVLADMLELGEKSEEAHREVGLCAANNDVDILLALGRDAQYYCEGFCHAEKSRFFADKAGLVRELDAIMCPGDCVLFKGSRGMKLEEAIEMAKKGWKAR